jgi:protein involved in polysaccharide export with SLBB domain
VHFPGIHYISPGTTLLDAISLAGGPLASIDIEEIQLSTTKEGKSTIDSFQLDTTLMGSKKENPELKPGDVIYVRQSNTYRDASFWLTVGTFGLSVIALGLNASRSSN